MKTTQTIIEELKAQNEKTRQVLNEHDAWLRADPKRWADYVWMRNKRAGGALK
jgi:hypothetical protein